MFADEFPWQRKHLHTESESRLNQPEPDRSLAQVLEQLRTPHAQAPSALSAPISLPEDRARSEIWDRPLPQLRLLFPLPAGAAFARVPLHSPHEHLPQRDPAARPSEDEKLPASNSLDQPTGGQDWPASPHHRGFTVS